VPQLSDPRAGDRPRLREADLSKHLINEVKDSTEKLVEQDGKPDPRFTATADDLKAKGVLDFQMDYATRLLARLAPSPSVQTAAAPAAAANPGSRR
jgi:carboxyl-terminal processing protease